MAYIWEKINKVLIISGILRVPKGKQKIAIELTGPSKKVLTLIGKPDREMNRLHL